MSTQSNITAVKDSVGIVRELALVIAVIVLLLDPGVIARWAKSVNEESKKQGGKSTEINLGLAKIAFDNSVIQISTLDAALKANEALKINAQLLVKNAATPQGAERAKEVLQNADSVSSQLQAGISSAKTSALAQDQIIQGASGQASGSGAYGIVVSADKQDDLAAYEVQQLKKRNLTDIAFYERGGFLRTVARFSDREKAEQALSTIKQYRSTAYIINLDKWCSNSQDSGRQVSGVTVFTCQ